MNLEYIADVWGMVDSLAKEYELPSSLGTMKEGYGSIKFGHHGEFAFREHNGSVSLHWGHPVAEPEQFLDAPASIIRNGTEKELAMRILTDCVSMVMAREVSEDLGMRYNPETPFNGGPYLVGCEIKRNGLHKTLADSTGKVVATHDMEGFPDWRAEVRRLFIKTGRMVHAPVNLPEIPRGITATPVIVGEGHSSGRQR